MTDTTSTPVALLRAMRPRQWTKNVLVVVAPLAGGRLLEPGVGLRVLGAFMLFALASSAMYLLNDIVDRERDAAHPMKRSRPVASGLLPVRTAAVASIALALLAVAGSVALGPMPLAAVIAVYLGATTLYSLRLQHEALWDVVLVASGFLLRAVAGGAATGTPVSAWFLVTATAGALFVAAGKRASELAAVPAGSVATRPSLAAYTPGYLRFVWTAAATVTVTATAVWGLEVAVGSARPVLAQVSVAPLALAVLRYGWWVDRGEAEAPEDVLRGDRSLVALGAMWAALLLGSTGALG